jgi:hypothetical protein
MDLANGLVYYVAFIFSTTVHEAAHASAAKLLQHFIQENKDRSIFRKNIGRALLSRDNDPYLAEWERDRTSRKQHGPEADLAKRKAIEAEVTRLLQSQFSFVVLQVDSADERKRLESRLNSTLSLCEECRPLIRLARPHVAEGAHPRDGPMARQRVLQDATDDR